MSENLYNLPNIREVMAKNLAAQMIHEEVDLSLDNVIPFPVREEPEDWVA